MSISSSQKSAELGLIIAAGAGTRLEDGSHQPKSLRKVCGLPLIKRIILSGAKAGLKKIVIVVGFEKEKLIGFIQSQKWPVEIEFVDNLDWKKSNGVSVLAARTAIKENFILLMSDHIFDPATLAKLRAADLSGLDVVLAVDYKTHQIFDKDDATKVEVQNGKIKAIAKELVQFNAIDSGMFLMTPDIFVTLKEVLVDGNCSLSDAVRRLGSQGRAGVMDVGDAYWQDVDTPESLKHAEKILLDACRKKTDGFISRNFNRYISLFISSYLVKTPLTANQATLLITVIGVFSGYFAAQGTYWDFLLAAFLFKWTSILDGVDGELAKLKFTASKMGQWLDTISDNLTYVIFTVGTALGLYRTQAPGIGTLGPAACFGIVMLLVVMYVYIIKYTDSGSLLAVQNDFQGQEQKNPFKRVLVKLYFVIKRDFFASLFLVLAIFGKPHWILFLIALATNVAWLVIVQNMAARRPPKKDCGDE